MRYFLIKKGLIALSTLFCIASATFFLMHWIPGNPFLDERPLPEEVMKSLNAHYGLDAPLRAQFINYLKELLQGNLGPSLLYEGRSVDSIIINAFPISFLLGLEALLLAIGIGTFNALLSVFFRSTNVDRIILLYAVLTLSIPSFVLATFLQYFFSIKLNLLPVARWGSFAHTLLPAITLSAFPSAFITRLLRTSLLQTLQQDYIITAKTKGLHPFRILIYHVLPNSLLPCIAYLGPLAAAILTGSFGVEKVFGIPGLGGWFVSSIGGRDYTMIMGLTLFYSTIVIFFAYLVDIAYIFLNPRLRFSKDDFLDER